MKGKITEAVIPKQSNSRTKEVDKLICSDLCGSMQIGSVQGNIYMMAYMDDKTEWIHFNFLRKFLQQVNELKAFQEAFERQEGINIKCLKTNKRGKYTSKEVQDYLKKKESSGTDGAADVPTKRLQRKAKHDNYEDV